MRKLILGIVTVVCVQFTFVIFMQLQSPLDVAGVPVFASLPAVNTDLSWLDDLDRSGLSVPEPETPADRSQLHRSPGSTPSSRFTGNADRPTTARHTQRSGGRSLKGVKAFFPDPPKAASGDFDTVVISYRRPAEFADCDSFDPPKSRKRSIFAKAFAIKKPVGWVRSLKSILY